MQSCKVYLWAVLLVSNLFFLFALCLLRLAGSGSSVWFNISFTKLHEIKCWFGILLVRFLKILSKFLISVIFWF